MSIVVSGVVPPAETHNRRANKSTGQIGILAAIIVYLAAMVYVGFYFSKKGGGNSADEFYLDGRKLSALVIIVFFGIHATGGWGAVTDNVRSLAGMVSGGIMVFMWKYCVRPLGGAWNIYELLPAFMVACAAIAAVLLATAPPAKDILDEFDSVGR